MLKHQKSVNQMEQKKHYRGADTRRYKGILGVGFAVIPDIIIKLIFICQFLS